VKPSAILTADLHLREDTPVARLDDYFAAQDRKIRFIADLQKAHNGIPVFDAGDLFNKWRGSPFLLQWAIRTLPDIITIDGNHDQSSHNRDLFEKTSLAVLKAAGVARVPTEPISVAEIPARIHFFPWGATLYGVQPTKPGDAKQVALVHTMTYVGRSPYPGCKDPGAGTLMEKLSGFDLIVSGHNHKNFVVEREGRVLVNPGSMMRSTADQADHKPRVYLWYAEDNHVEAVFLPIEEGVVSREHIEVVEQREGRMSAFVERLNTDVEIGLSFERNMERHLAANRMRTRTKEIIEEAMR